MNLNTWFVIFIKKKKKNGNKLASFTIINESNTFYLNMHGKY